MIQCKRDLSYIEAHSFQTEPPLPLHVFEKFAACHVIHNEIDSV